MATKTNRQPKAEAPRPEPTAAEKRAMQIESATYEKEWGEGDARKHIDDALGQLHRMVDEIEREAKRPTNTLAQVLYHIRHQTAWAYANMSSTLDNADNALRGAMIAKAKLEVLHAAEPAA